MRSFNLKMVLCALMVLLTARPAHAWWEFLNYLSGPGRFNGPKFDFRVWCFGPEVPLSKLDNLVAIGVVKTLSARNEATVKAAVDSWNDVVTQLKEINGRLHIFESDQLDKLEGGFKKLKASDFPNVTIGDRSAPAPAGTGPLSPGPLKDFVDQLEAVVDQLYKASASLASTGVFVSFCSPETQRTFAVEVGFTSLQANSDPNYARDYPIRLNTFTAALSYRVPLPADRDVIDVGVIGGMYQFSSRGFATFRGPIVEPFVDLHGPTRWVNDRGAKQLVGLVTVRLGLVWFPGGFDTEKFAAVPAKVRHIPGGEATRSVTVFFNLTPLLRHRTRTF